MKRYKGKLFIIVCANGQRHLSEEAANLEIATHRAGEKNRVCPCGPHTVVCMVPEKRKK